MCPAYTPPFENIFWNIFWVKQGQTQRQTEMRGGGGRGRYFLVLLIVFSPKTNTGVTPGEV